MKSIEFGAFFHTDETSKLDECDVDYDLSQCEIRQVTFYDIDFIHPYYGENKDYDYTTVGSCGTEFVVPLKYYEVKIKIELLL